LVLPAGALVYLAASLALRQGLLPPVLALLLSLASFVPMPERGFSAARRAGEWTDRRFPILLGLSAASLVAFYGWLWGVHAFGFQPVVHDEFAYLFQTKTFLAGHLFFPSPPEPVFFDAFHILTEPVYASKYPPGHALFLAPGAALGNPWLVPLLASGVALFLLGRLARPHLGGTGALLLVLLFGVSPASIQTATTYFSQTTYLAAALLFLFFFRRSARSGRLADAAWAGLFLGAALLTRYLNALVLALFAAILALAFREARTLFSSPRRAAAFAIPLALSLALLLGYDRAITGSAFRTPWELYAERSQPEDRFGFYRGEPIEAREIGPGKRIYNERVLYPNRTRYTPPFAVRSLFSVRIPMSAWEAAPPAAFVFLAPLLLGLRGRGRRTALLALAFVGLLHAAYVFYWFPWGPYYHEITPALLALLLLGARSLVDRARAEFRGGPLLAAALLLLLVGAQAVSRLPFQIDFRREKASAHARFEGLVERRVPARSVLFIRYAANHNPDLDLVNNEPDLARAERLLVHDLGEARNRAFREAHFPDRAPFHFDEGTRLVTPGYAPPATVR
jgi:4-amino-4-deoxy-L-arabinose transferase-like glycosyltransferase